MPKLSKYKAAGRTASSYQKSIGDVNKLGLGLQHAQWKGEEQRSLYGAIGATTANILGIVKEQKMMGELNKLKESAGNLPGVVKESQEYQRGGKIGEILGMGKGSRDVYKSRFTGEEISDTTMYGIGKAESLKQGSTMYGDEQAVSDLLASGEGYNPVRDRAFAQVGAKTQEEYDELTDVDFNDWIATEEQSLIKEGGGPDKPEMVNYQEPYYTRNKKKRRRVYPKHPKAGTQDTPGVGPFNLKPSGHNTEDDIISYMSSQDKNMFGTVGSDKVEAKIPSSIIERIIAQESSGDPGNVSKSGATGLMGIMPSTAKQPGFGVAPMEEEWEITDPASNIKFGTNYINALYNKFEGDMEKTLMAYNWGYGNVSNMTGATLIPEETTNYVDKILGRKPVGASWEDEETLLSNIRNDYKGLY